MEKRNGKSEANESAAGGRRDFIKGAAAAALAVAAGGVSTVESWAAAQAPVKYELKLRQSYIYDGVMDMFLRSVNSKSGRLQIKSSYVDGDLGWGHERDHCMEVPFWYTEGEPCEIYMGRGPALAQLADAGLIIPLDDYIDNSGMLGRDDYVAGRYGSVLDSATYRGKLWGIPLIGDTYALFHNNQLYRDAGIDEKPVTWEQVIETARALTRDTTGDGEPDVFGYQQCSFQYPLQILTAGIDLVDLENKRVLYDTEAGVDALETYRRCRETSPPHINFENGDIGMKMSVITNAHGRYSHLDYTPMRIPEGSRRANTFGDSDGIVAFALASGFDRDTTFAAWKAVEYMASARMFFKMVEYAHMLPMRKSILESDRYDAYRRKNPQIEAFIEELEWAVPKPCIPEYRFLEVVMREILYPVQREGWRDLTIHQIREHCKRQADRANEVLAKAKW